MARFTYTPTIGARVEHAGHEWTVWSKADTPGTWWLNRLVKTDNTDNINEESWVTVKAHARTITPARRTT